jgi:hypothetical protein
VEEVEHGFAFHLDPMAQDSHATCASTWPSACSTASRSPTRC